MLTQHRILVFAVVAGGLRDCWARRIRLGLVGGDPRLRFAEGKFDERGPEQSNAEEAAPVEIMMVFKRVSRSM